MNDKNFFIDNTNPVLSNIIQNEHILILNLINETSIITVTDANGIILYVNQNFCDLTEYTKEELIGNTHRLIKHPDNDDSLYKEMWNCIKNKQIYRKTLKNISANNKTFYTSNTILPILSDKNEIIYFINVATDVTELYIKNNLLESVRFCDKKTEMYNYEKLISDLKTYKYGAMILISIDDMDNINSFYGHDFGDLLIKSFANRFYMEFDSFDTYCIESNRFIGLYGFLNQENMEFNQSILVEDSKKRVKSLSSAFEIENQQLSINTTVGFSFGETEKLIHKARIAHSLAKEDFTVSFSVYNSRMKDKQKLYIKNKELSQIIQKAIAKSSVVPFYQPIVNNANGEIERYEVLARISHENTFLNPGGDNGFIKIAKISKQYHLITKIIINKAFERFKDTDKSFSINISIEDIESLEMREFIYEKIKMVSCPERIIFEILEDKDMMQSYEILQEFITKIKSFGSKIAIDDFGSGYSNFIVLMNLQVDYLKFDGSLILGLNDKSTSELVKSLVVHAKERGIKTIAEYVENENVFINVKKLGFDYSQGYHIGKPNEELLDSYIDNNL